MGGTDYLLAIGIGKYEDNNFEDLSPCVYFIDELTKVFVNTYNYKEENIIKLYDEEATEENISQTFFELEKKLSNDDSLVILFIGNSIYRKKLGEAYWIPSNAKGNNPSKYISNTDLLTVNIKGITAKRIVIVSGSYVSENVNDTIENILKDQYTSVYFLASSNGEARNNFLFFKKIKTYLTSYSDKKLSLTDLAYCIDTQKDLEHKIFYSNSISNDDNWFFEKNNTEDKDWLNAKTEDTEEAFLEFLSKYPESSKKQEAETILTEKEIIKKKWVLIQKSNKITDFESFIQFFPNSRFVKTAREKIKHIKEEAYLKTRSQTTQKEHQIITSNSNNNDSPRNQIKIRKRNKNNSNFSKRINSSSNKNSKKINFHKGKLLYKIPEKMTLRKRYNCEIRLAKKLIPDEIFWENIAKEQKDKFIAEEIKTTELMAVELLSPGNEKKLEIISLSKVKQSILDDDYTSWEFDIVPREIGYFNIVIKVTAIYYSPEFGEMPKTKVWRKSVSVSSQSEKESYSNSTYGLLVNEKLKFDKESLKTKIANNQLSEVLKELLDFTFKISDELHNYVSIVNARYLQLQQDMHTGVMRHIEYTAYIPAINLSLLNLIDQISYDNDNIVIQNLDKTGVFQ